MKYRVDTGSLRTAAADLREMQSSISIIRGNVRSVQAQLSMRVRSRADIDREFRTVITELEQLRNSLRDAGRFLETSAGLYEAVESRNQRELQDDSGVVSITCSWVYAPVQPPADDSFDLGDAVSMVPLIGVGWKLGEAQGNVQDGNGFVYGGQEGIEGLFTLSGDAVKSGKFAYDRANDLLEIGEGVVKNADDILADFVDGLPVNGVVALIANILSNLGEGNSAERTVSETVLETLIDLLMDGLIGLGLGAVIAALGVTPAGWVIALGSVGISFLIDLLVSLAAGEATSFSEVCSDVILDAAEIVADGVGDAIEAAGDFFSDIGEGISGWCAEVFG